MTKRKNVGKFEGLVKQLAVTSSNVVKEDHSKRTQVEGQLESAIRETAEDNPTTSCQRWKKYGKHLLHGRVVLIIVVTLCFLDCGLVIGELILDMHAIKEMSIDSNAQSSGNALHNNTDPSNSHLVSFTVNESEHHERTIRAVPDQQTNSEGHTAHQEHPLEEKIGHAFHYASITILAILLVYTLIKIFCEGKCFFKKKLEIEISVIHVSKLKIADDTYEIQGESLNVIAANRTLVIGIWALTYFVPFGHQVFDAFIVTASFIIDLAFLKGITTLPIQESAYILSFILPWRVIRVVNSLVVAIMDNEHFKLILVYQSKKRIADMLEDTRVDHNVTKDQLRAVRKMCVESGTEEWVINHTLGRIASKSAAKHKSALISFANLSAAVVVDEKCTFASQKRRINQQQQSRALVDVSKNDTHPIQNVMNCAHIMDTITSTSSESRPLVGKPDTTVISFMDETIEEKG